MVLFLNLDHGTWHVAPYLDKHGEVDPALRRHHQLFLNQKRYDALLRKVWLEGGVQSLIARRLEGDVNNGGWESWELNTNGRQSISERALQQGSPRLSFSFLTSYLP